MFANVFTKTSRDRFTGLMIGTFSVALMLWFALAVYRSIDVSFYYQLGPQVIEMMGIPEGGDAAGLGFGAIYNLTGALMLAGLAISMGSAAVAGEESRGTLGLLLGNPRSRAQVLLAKAASMAALIALAALILWGAGAVIPMLLDIDMTGIHVGATVLHLFVNTLFYGFVALALGAWTGSRTAASGGAVAVMMVSYLASGIFPLVERLEGLVWIFPWHYYSGSQPVVNGVDWGDLAVLTGLSLILVASAVLGVNRRDLKSQSTGVTMLDRLRSNPRTNKLMDRIAGSARVSRISMKTASDHQGLLVITGTVMFYMGLMMGPIYGLLPEGFAEAFADFPDSLIAMIGGADMSTVAGWYQGEIFSLTGPIAFVALTALIGSRALAGEEDNRTMGLLLANPVRRSKVVIEKATAMVVYAAILGVVTFLGTWAGVVLGGVELPVANIASTSALLALLGLVFGGVALLGSAATGQARIAVLSSVGVTIASYFVFSFLPLAENLAAYARWSPFHYYLGGDPLVNGMNWGHAGVLAAMFLGLLGLSVPLFERRDLRG